MNSDFSVCPSYPPAVIVPKNVDDEMLKKVAKFRQGGRFPVLCYRHSKNGMVRRFGCGSGERVATELSHSDPTGDHAQQPAADRPPQEALQRGRAPPPGGD